MNHIIPSIDGVLDHFLYPLGLYPWLSGLQVPNVCVRSEEWHVHAGLVHSDPQFLARLANETWNVSAAKDHTTKAVLHEHFEEAEDLIIDRVIVTSPVGTVFLRTEEVRASEDKGSAGVVIASKKTTVGLPLLCGAISIVELTVLDHLSVRTNVFRIGRQSLSLSLTVI